MSEAPTTVIENAPAPPPAANTPEARTPEGQIKAVTEPLIPQTPTPPTPTATTVEAKPAEAPKESEKTLLNEKPKLNGAPEKYEEFKAPEGYETNPERMGKAQEIFKELDLSQAGGQKLVDFFMDEIKSVMEAPAKQWEEVRAKWLAEVKSDPVIGGKLDQVKATVARAIDGLGDPKRAAEFRQQMDISGVGNNPAFIHILYGLAQKVTEGTLVPGGNPSEVRAPNQPPRTAAHALYPGLK